MSQLPPLHPIAMTREVPCWSEPEHVVPSPTTVCNWPQTNDDTQARLAQIEAALNLLPLGYDPRRLVAHQSTILTSNLRRLSRRRPSARTDHDADFPSDARRSGRCAVANAPGQRQRNFHRPKRRQLHTRHRPRVLSVPLTTATCCSSLRIVLGSLNHPASASQHSWKTTNTS